VRVLRGRSDVNPNEPSGDGKTLIWHTATTGHEGVVKVLLGWGGVDPSEADNCGYTLFRRGLLGMAIRE